MRPLEELALLLTPPGGGVPLFSTGRSEQEELQRHLLQVEDTASITRIFRDNLARIPAARGIILAIPSDAGAGYRRGSNLGPAALRRQLLADGFYASVSGLVDIGDVRCVPQLLHDEMLSHAQVAAVRRSLYGASESPLPVSPLSIANRVWTLVRELNPRARLFTIGGDHSTALPAIAAMAHSVPRLAVVHIDAHTDLLEERLGVKYCYATWSWHANRLLGGGGRLLQVGIRASGKEQSHWESLGVRQFWANEIRGRESAALADIVAHLRRLEPSGIALSNDIDGTDDAWSSATGTPEPRGLLPDFVEALIQELPKVAPLVCGDIMEVAPSLGTPPFGTERTIGLAARYFSRTVRCALESTVR